MILEGIVTTVSPQDVLNVAPMGPEVNPALNMEKFILRPYRTSTTYANLKASGEGVFHVTDDVLLLARTAIGAAVEPPPATRSADVVAGVILLDACRYYEFHVVDLEDCQDAHRSSSRLSVEAGIATSSDSTARSTRSSRRRSWRLARRSCRSRTYSWNSAGSRSWSRRRADLRRRPPSSCCSSTSGRQPPSAAWIRN